MKILVTGASGHLGEFVVRELLAHRHAVRAFDHNASSTEREYARKGADLEFIYGDVTDRLALLQAAAGCHAIVHLAAIPAPHIDPHNLTHINVVGTHNVLAAAEAHDILRVAIASSCAVYGMAFALQPFDPEYVPMDEKHPVLPQDIYGLSKLLNEQTAAAYTRRADMATVCLRLPHVMNFQNRGRWNKGFLQHGEQWKANDLWTYIDIRDAARAFRLAVEVPVEGSHVLLVAARDSLTTSDIRKLIDIHYPRLSRFVEDIEPTASLYDTTLAERVLGFTPHYSWRDDDNLADIDTSLPLALEA